MPVTYTKPDREKAESQGLKLITIDIGNGVTFQGCVSEDEEARLLQYYLEFCERRRDSKKGDAQA